MLTRPPPLLLLALFSAAAAAAEDGAEGVGGPLSARRRRLGKGSPEYDGPPPPGSRMSRFGRTLGDKPYSRSRLARLTPEQRQEHRERRTQKAKDRSAAWLEAVTEQVGEQKAKLGAERADALLAEAKVLHEEAVSLAEARYAEKSDADEIKQSRWDRSRRRREMSQRKMKLQQELGMSTRRGGWGSSSRRLLDDSAARDGMSLRGSKRRAAARDRDDRPYTSRERRQEVWRERTLKRAAEKGVSEEGMERLKAEMAAIGEEETALYQAQGRSRGAGARDPDVKEERRRLRESIRERRSKIRKELNSGKLA